jgi:antitoxin component of RelBE/YafQ-DinJ toxin-antitoxin module
MKTARNANPSKELLTVRLTPKEMAEFADIAKAEGMTMSDLVRIRVINSKRPLRKPRARRARAKVARRRRVAI